VDHTKWITSLFIFEKICHCCEERAWQSQGELQRAIASFAMTHLI